MELTPFDILQITLDEYQFMLAYATELVDNYGVDEWQKKFGSDVNSVEEMVFNYAVLTGNKEEAKKEIDDLLTNCSGRIDFENLTEIKQISKMN